MKNNYLYISTSLLLTLFTFHTSCQTPPAPSTPTNANVLDDVLPNFDLLTKEGTQIAEYVVEIFEDSKGNLWFGTMAKGAARYDGKTLTYFTTEDGLCGNTVSSFAEDKEGNIWFGSHTGLCKYDGRTFTTVRSTTGQHDRGEGWIGVQSDQEGNIWYSSSYGVFRQKGNSFSKFKLPIDSKHILTYSITPGKAGLDMVDKKGNLWFGTDGYGALKYDGKKFTHFTKEDGLGSNNITSIIEDRQGNIWFTCMQSYQPEMSGDGGLCRYDGKTFTQFPEMEGLNNNDLYTIYEDKKGIIWIGASGHGVYRYDVTSFTLINETDRMDLTSRLGLQGALEDSNGTLWFGFSGGLFRLEGLSIINVTQDGPWTLNDER